eukprot:4373807-Prymnesium_polylepis.1
MANARNPDPPKMILETWRVESETRVSSKSSCLRGCCGVCWALVWAAAARRRGAHAQSTQHSHRHSLGAQVRILSDHWKSVWTLRDAI